MSRIDRRFDLRHVAASEKEQGINRAFKGTLMLVLGILLLAGAWWVFPVLNAPSVILYIITVVMFIGFGGYIWLIADGLKDVIMAKKYLNEWEG